VLVHACSFAARYDRSGMTNKRALSWPRLFVNTVQERRPSETLSRRWADDVWASWLAEAGRGASGGDGTMGVGERMKTLLVVKREALTQQQSAARGQGFGAVRFEDASQCTVSHRSVGPTTVTARRPRKPLGDADRSDTLRRPETGLLRCGDDEHTTSLQSESACALLLVRASSAAAFAWCGRQERESFLQ